MKSLNTKISKKLLIGIIASIVVVGGGITTGVILMNNNKDNQKQEETKQEEKQKDTILLKEDLKFEINSEVNLLSLVSEENKVKVLSDDEKIDTSKLGEKEITIKYEVEEKEEEKTFKITIVDTQAPTIDFKKELSTNVGTKIDLLKGVKVSDNSKENIKATIEGDYSFNNEGTYNLKYVAVDSSNNKKEEEFTLKVNKKKTNNTQTNNQKPNNNQQNNTKPNNSKNNKPNNKTGNEVLDNFDLDNKEYMDWLYSEMEKEWIKDKPKYYQVETYDFSAPYKGYLYDINDADFWWEWQVILKIYSDNILEKEIYAWVLKSSNDDISTWAPFGSNGQGYGQELTGNYKNIAALFPKPGRDGTYEGEKTSSKHFWYYRDNMGKPASVRPKDFAKWYGENH